MFAELGSVVVAFSGGVDSSRRRGDRLPRARRQRPRRHRRLAVRRAGRARGREARRASTSASATRSSAPNELARPGYVANGRDRCYFCKTELYDTLAAHYPRQTLLSGANKDDQGDWRPGLRAAAEHDVQHPLIDVTKDAGASARPRAATAERGEARHALPRVTHPLRHGRRPRDARADRPRRAGGQSARLPDPARPPPRHPRPPRGRRAGPRARAARSGADHRRRCSAAGYAHATIDDRPFRSGRLNVEPARPAASR